MQKSILKYNDGTQPSQLKTTTAPELQGTKPTYRRIKSFSPPPANAKPALTGIQPLKALPKDSPTDASEKLNQLITQMVLNNIPHTFDEDKDWGGTSERWDGVRFRLDGLQIKTNRKKKEVRHGTWKKYSAQLIDPRESFTIEIKNLRELPGETIGFDIVCAADIALEGRQSKWVKGVQLYSLSATGHAKIGLTINIELTVSADTKNFPPDLVFTPVATAADLDVREFRIDRVSKAGGEFAQQVSKAVRSKLDEKIETEEDKLVEKINKKIADKQDRLRLSISDALNNKWLNKVRGILPASVKQVVK